MIIRYGTYIFLDTLTSTDQVQAVCRKSIYVWYSKYHVMTQLNVA